jgi:hypothetical protein
MLTIIACVALMFLIVYRSDGEVMGVPGCALIGLFLGGFVGLLITVVVGISLPREYKTVGGAEVLAAHAATDANGTSPAVMLLLRDGSGVRKTILPLTGQYWAKGSAVRHTTVRRMVKEDWYWLIGLTPDCGDDHEFVTVTPEIEKQAVDMVAEKVASDFPELKKSKVEAK